MGLSENKLTVYGAACERAQERFGLTYEELTLRRRWPRQVRARFWLWMILHDEIGWGYMEIERCVGFDHATIIHGVRKARKLWPSTNSQ